MSEITEQILVTSLEQGRVQWQDQINRLIERGYHIKRGITAQEYRILMPEFQPPTEAQISFGIPLLIDPEIVYQQQLKLMVVEDDLDNISDSDISNAIGVNTPQIPYQIWVQDGLLYKNKSGAEVVEQLSANERGLTLIEGLALLREKPEIRRQLTNYSIGLLGSRTPKGLVPQILHWPYNQNPSMNVNFKDPTLGEEECWAYSIKTMNRTGGWPTCKNAA